jgi:hypothetical protein
MKILAGILAGVALVFIYSGISVARQMRRERAGHSAYLTTTRPEPTREERLTARFETPSWGEHHDR